MCLHVYLQAHHKKNAEEENWWDLNGRKDNTYQQEAKGAIYTKEKLYKMSCVHLYGKIHNRYDISFPKSQTRFNCFHASSIIVDL